MNVNEALTNKMDDTNEIGIAPSQVEKTKVSIEVQTEQSILHRRKLDLDKSIATPPSELRKEIYHLRDELTEAYEFHDLELQVLKEDYELCTGKSATGGKSINDLEKSVKDAEQIILEGNKEISVLKTSNQDLCKKLQEEYNKYKTLKAQHEDEVSKLQIVLKKKDVEIENLKKDKDDFDFRLELLNENYNRKISELKLALEKKIEKESENEKNATYDELQRRLTEENEKTKELSKKLEDLNLELILYKEKVKLLEEQLVESCKRKYSYSLQEVSLETERTLHKNDETNRNVCQACEKPLGAQHEVSIDEMNISLLFKDQETGAGNKEKEQQQLVDASVQTYEDSLKNSDREIEDIRCSFEKELKELKDEHNTKLKSLECSNENLQESNLCLTEKLNAANSVMDELKEKLLISIENVDDLRRQVDEMKSSELKPIKEYVNSSSQSEIMENVVELEQKIKELQSENDDLLEKLSNRSEELKLAIEENQALKENHEKELTGSIHDWGVKIEELKLEKETLNNIVSMKDEELRSVMSDLKETKNKLEESERGLKTYITENESYIDLLRSEKEELQNWIKTKEEEMNNLNVIVENELIRLKTDSELKIEEIKKMYEVEINNLKNENDGLYEQVESIRNMYETEVLKFVNLIASEKMKNSAENTDSPYKKVTHDSFEVEKNDTILGECISKIKLERDSIVEMFNSGLMETSASITVNVKSENVSDASTLIQESNPNEIMSLVPVRTNGKYSDGTIENYNLHTVDGENMQLKINSESVMIDFVNVFAREMLRENIMNPEELKTCTNIFYSLLNKYLLLLEMYSRLKQEFEDYKINEEKERFDIINRTVQCLDTLCTQLEVSSSSLNLSNNSSLMSFHEGIPSSTIMEEDYTEMEISAVNNVTMSKDPLALTQDITLKTPMKTPFKSAKKLNPFPFRTPLRSVSKPVKTPLRPESVRKPILRTPASVRPEKFSSDTQLIQLKNNIIMKDKEISELKELYNSKIESAEDVIKETLKNFALLEKRISKLEVLSQDLQTERENLIKESAGLKESLTRSSEEIANIRKKLVLEIISLSPELEGTVSKVSVTDLLSIFIQTIMESCKKMPEELSDKLMSEVEALTEKNELYESKISESEKEMKLLKEINAALIEEKEVIEKAMVDRNEEIKNLMQDTCELKTLKSKMKDMEERLIENDSMLQTELYLKENALKDLQKLKTFFEDVEKENSCFKEKIEQSDRVMHELKAELMLAKKEQMNNEMKEDELMKEIEQLKCILSDAEGKNKDLQNLIDNFEEEVSSVQSKNKYKTCQLELLNKKITDAENLVQERDKIIHELKQKIAEVEGKLESKSQEFSDFNMKYQNSLEEIEELRQTIDGYRESVNEEMVTLKNKLTVADDDLSSKLGIIQELSAQLEEARENARVQEETITSLKVRVEQLENEREELEVLKSELEKREEAERVMANEIEQLKTKIIASETRLNCKMEDVEKLSVELGRAEELKLENEEKMSAMKQLLQEFEDNKAKLESMDSALEKHKEIERVIAEETASLKSKLLQSEAELTDKIEKLAEMTAFIEKTKDDQIKDAEMISSLKIQLQEMESDRAKLGEMASAVEKLRETEKNMTEKIDDLNSRVAASETEKKEMITMMEETKEINDDIISNLQKELEGLRNDNLKLHTLEEAIEKLEESEKVRMKELEEVNLKLSSVESELAVKIEVIEKMSNQLEEAEKVKGAYEESISALNREIKDLKNDVFNFETVQNLLEVARNERNEKEMVIEDLNNRLNEFTTSEKCLNSEIDSLRMKLTEAEENIRMQKEKLSELEEIESDLVKTKDALGEVQVDNERLKQIENELESRNKQLETINNELSWKVKSFEVLNEMNCKEIQVLRDELAASTDALNSSRAETERLEKGLREMEENIEKVIAKLKLEVDLPENESLTQDGEDELIDNEKALDISKGAATTVITTETRKTVIEKLNKLFVLHGQQVERLKLELKNSKEARQNLETEIDKLNAKNADVIVCKSETFKKPELGIPLKTPPVSKRNRTGDSPSFISRRLEKLENLNDLLSGTLQKIIRALDIPVEDNLFSVGRYASSEAQIMKYISTLNFDEKDTSKVNDSANEEVEGLSKVVKELRNTVSVVARHVGLPNGNVNGQLIVSQIDNMIADVKKEFLDRIDILRQDNQHLDDDNNLLQTEMKKLMEQNNANKTKLNASAKSEELLQDEIGALKEEIMKLQSKNKINRKNDLWNRKLDKLEEMHQNLVDLIKKMLALTGMENLAKLNLLTARQFEVESKKVWDYFSDWVTSKTKEVEELKTQMKELDEECESYSRVIIEARQETERVWEKCRGEVKDLKARIAELEEENKTLVSDNKTLWKRVKALENGGDMKDWTENGTKESEELKKQNIALQSRIKDLEDSLSQARKQIEELDEECESYAKVIKESQRESLLCEETKNEIKALKEEIEKMDKEKKYLEKDKEILQEKIRILESSDHQKTGTGDRGRKGEKEVKELKKTVALREMKILELEQLNEKNIIHKSQIKYLESSLAALKDQLAQEELKNQKLQREVEELSVKTQKRKGSDDLELLDQLRARDSLGMAAIHQIDDKEKLQKLEKDNRMLKEICRSRYNEIKRLETENQTLKGHERTTKILFLYLGGIGVMTSGFMGLARITGSLLLETSGQCVVQLGRPRFKINKPKELSEVLGTVDVRLHFRGPYPVVEGSRYHFILHMAFADDRVWSHSKNTIVNKSGLTEFKSDGFTYPNKILQHKIQETLKLFM